MSAPPVAPSTLSPGQGDVLVLQGIRKSYNVGTPVENEVLHGIDLRLGAHEFVALTGPSGSGKSTLLNVIGLLERPSAGRLFIDGHDTATLDEAALTALRGSTIGFVFQYHHLLPAFTALENVLLPSIIAHGVATAQAEARARALLQRVGLAQAMGKRPGELSGGMQQRVAIARALVLQPRLILADEPTGNLDTASADAVFALLRDFNREHGSACLIVTHDPRLAARCDRVLELVDGRLVADTPRHARGGA
ncbi:MAG: ABC transporter ATP-binding protein [Tepidimonas ignava]|uniref:Lipoprotein-releasing system ATP-binding protein n=1 Tax=Tepidimonas ignava TaxID=114249 RepID=A0A4R3LD30_9BURK|nr:ABC transporter ATP-binding protein [Tepidimonas ignava]MCX7814077.1 ABC transporter ATP-binding protein [Tepidimonas ignava]TCS97819.1 lipoprotein-releasing system ATP-binding protein [Tepidimonas ignava]TSE23681.1 Lipoprotein-releasing system ATP-binding protein LolD [Tepidimonas ignava]